MSCLNLNVKRKPSLSDSQVHIESKSVVIKVVIKKVNDGDRHTQTHTLQMVVFIIMLTQSYRKYKGKGTGLVTEWMYPLGAVHK